jgi:hypothetical protein
MKLNSLDDLRVKLATYATSYYGVPCQWDEQDSGDHGSFFCPRRVVESKSSPDSIIVVDDSEPVSEARRRRPKFPLGYKPLIKADRCGCGFRVNWRKVAVSKASIPGELHITKGAVLVHHQECVNLSACRPSNERPMIVGLPNVPQEIHDALVSLLAHGHPGARWAQGHVEGLFNIRVEDDTFNNLYYKLRTTTPISLATQVRDTIDWATAKGISIAMSNDVDQRVDRLFLMTHEMAFQCIRNGDLLVLDTTHGTNSFGFPLALIVCLSHQGKVHPIAAAIVKQQKIEDFQWMLDCLKEKLDERDPGPNGAWARIKTWLTDGDAAMESALTSRSAAVHIRCEFHITMNVRHQWRQVQPRLPVDEVEKRVKEFKTIVQNATAGNFESMKADLHTLWLQSIGGKDLVEYMNANIWPNQSRFVYCFVERHLTFGIHATSIVEGLNKDVKQFGDRLTNDSPVLSLFKTLWQLSHNREQKAMHVRQIDDAKQNLATRDPANSSTIGGQARQAVTEYAALQIIEQHSTLGSHSVAPHADHDTYIVTHSTTKESYTVIVTASTMSCTCNYPCNWLLPCRHVLSANWHCSSRSLIEIGQIGRRWHKSHMPVFDMAKFVPRTAVLDSTISSDRAASLLVASARDSTFLQMQTVYDYFDTIRINMTHELRGNPAIRAEFFELMQAVVVAMKDSDAWRAVHARVVKNELIDAVLKKGGRNKRFTSQGEAGKRKSSQRKSAESAQSVTLGQPVNHPVNQSAHMESSSITSPAAKRRRTKKDRSTTGAE